MQDRHDKVVLITGAGKRIGSAIARYLHDLKCRVVLHYHHSESSAKSLCDELNIIRKNSAMLLQGDIRESDQFDTWMASIQKTLGGLDVLINNAADFYPTLLGEVTEDQWDRLMNTNLKGPFFLSQAAMPLLKKNKGCIVNIADIHGKRPMKRHVVYSISKAGLIMLTKSLAREWGDSIRVNAICPGGGVMWPEGQNSLTEFEKQAIIDRTALKREGAADDVAKAVGYFIFHADYVTGQVLAVDGGRSLKMG